ncbi:MAG: hypothetical protein IJ192_04755 [Clostridia bacterium]|nr:hypothetical protein [Clostridia bacterium]MBR2176957.1 hypothetical protein [Clostridia bacterium]
MRFRFGSLTLEMSFPLVAVMTAAVLYDSTLSVAVCFAAVILHEGGHLLVLWKLHSMPKHIKLTLFDIAIIDKNKSVRGTKRELAVVLAGIVSNLLFGALSALLLHFTGIAFFEGLLNANLTLAVFNSLPVDSLDGGQALFLLLCEKMNMYRAMTILDIISVIVLIPTACLGFLVLLRSGYNFTLLLTAFYLMGVVIMRHSRIITDKFGEHIE